MNVLFYPHHVEGMYQEICFSILMNKNMNLVMER